MQEQEWRATPEEIRDAAERFYFDPVGFVFWAFNWGHGDLTGRNKEPEVWQVKILHRIGEELKKQHLTKMRGEDPLPVRIAVASGHGIGKTAFQAWVLLWVMFTRPRMLGRITAQKLDQLRGVTWMEVSKWQNRSRVGHLFDHSATSLKFKESPKDWNADAVGWSQHNPNAFAGKHADFLYFDFDEASEIIDQVWTVADGAFAEGDANLWLAFGNPTNNKGRFFDCFKPNSGWVCFAIDATKVGRTNKAFQKELIERYGWDSDVIRVRIRGLFPRQGFDALFDETLITEAMNRDIHNQAGVPKIMGIDTARFGDDQTCFAWRQGLNQPHDSKFFNKLDTIEITQRAIHWFKVTNSDEVVVDEIGIGGAAVVDNLKRAGIPVRGFRGSASSPDDTMENLRTYSYFRFAEKLNDGFKLRKSDSLREQMLATTYTFSKRTQKRIITDKDVIKLQLGRSPDELDALTMCFAYNSIHKSRGGGVYKTIVAGGGWR